MLHGIHIQQTATEMAMSTTCIFPYNRHALLNWKYMLWRYSNFLISDINVCVDILVSHCKVHGKRQFEEKQTCSLCSIIPTTATRKIFDTRK